MDAFQELYGEIDGDAQVSSEGRRTIAMIQEIGALATEAGYTADEISALTYNRDVKSLQSTLRALTQVVRAGKRAVRLVMKLEKKAQMAQLEATEINRQQLAVETQLLETQKQAELAKKRDSLKEEVDYLKWLKKQEEQIRQKGGFRFGKIGIYSFPDMPKTLRRAIDIAKSLVPYLMAFLLPAFLFRIIYNQFAFASDEKFDAALRDVLMAVFLFCVFPLVVEFTIGGSDALAQAVQAKVQAVSTHPESIPKEGLLQVERWLLYAWNFVKTSLFWLAEFVFSIGIALYITVFPIMILLSKMQGTRLPLSIFFFTFLLLNLWPVFWHLTALIGVTLWDPSEFADRSSGASVVFSLLQFVSPFLLMKILQAVAPTDAASQLVKTPSQIASRFLQGVLNPTRKGSGGSGGSGPGGGAGGPGGAGGGPGLRAQAGRAVTAAASLAAMPPAAAVGHAAGALTRSAFSAGVYVTGQTLGRTASGISRGRQEARRPESTPGSVLKATAAGVAMNARTAQDRTPASTGWSQFKETAGQFREGFRSGPARQPATGRTP
jgi:hypothetical protein